MDLKLNRERIVCSVPVLDTEVTQTVEHDFYLPDYCPDIFRVLKCCIIPGISSTGINGNRLTFDLNVVVRVLYRSQDASGISCIEQSFDYSKTLDLPADTINPGISVTPQVEYVNCRVVNPRRLDVRGNVMCTVKVTGERTVDAVSDAFGAGIQLKKAPIVFPAKRLVCAKRITVIEELELAAGKPPFGALLRSSVLVKKGETKIIPGKLITKGEAEIDLLYLPRDSSGSAPEAMKFSIPFSQIIDIEGIEEGFETDIDISASKCVMIPKNGETEGLECELVLLVGITAVRYETRELVNDAYSTLYESECTSLGEAPALEAKRLNVNAAAECSISCSDGGIAKVFDLWCDKTSVSARFDESKGCAVIFGSVMLCMLGKLEDATAVYAEKECAFELPIESINEPAEITAVCSGVSCSYNLADNGTVSAKAEAQLSVTVCRRGGSELLSEIKVFTDRPKQTDKRCAVKICYTDSTESLWEIAKKYSTNTQAITEENPAEEEQNERSNCRRALIIPIKN